MSKQLRHIDSLDGVRALAIIAVIIFHMGFTWLPGGYLGVDVFFVLSGYLITWILLDRIRRLGSIDFKAFYLARARRLVPAMVFLALGVLIGVALWAPDTIYRFLHDLPFALTGTTNWWFIAEKQDYFQQLARPSLLQHTWSLAIEAQFYLLWPIVVTVLARRLHEAWVRRAAILGAVASWIALFYLFTQTDSAFAGGHLYFGTDTHSSGLFLGAALAVAWVPQNLNTFVVDSARYALNAVSIASLAALIWAFFNVNEYTGDFFTAGFVIANVGATLLVATLVHPASWLAKWFSNPVLLWIGSRSYGLYLWHWVVIQVLRPGRDITLARPWVYLLQIVLIAAIAEFSYRFVEMPVRSGAIRRFVWMMTHQSARTKRYIALGVASVTAIPLLSAAAISANAVSVSDGKTDAVGLVVRLDVTDIPNRNRPVAAPTATAKPNPVYVFGDSVVLSAKTGFQKGFDVAGFNAKVARQAPELITEISNYVASSQFGDHDVVFDIGVNGTLQAKHLKKIFTMLKTVDRVVIINTSVPRSWQDGNNALIAVWAARYPNVRIADWLHASDGHPEYFVSDGIHLTSKGVAAYIKTVQKAFDSFD